MVPIFRDKVGYIWYRATTAGRYYSSSSSQEEQPIVWIQPSPPSPRLVSGPLRRCPWRAPLEAPCRRRVFTQSLYEYIELNKALILGVCLKGNVNAWGRAGGSFDFRKKSKVENASSMYLLLFYCCSIVCGDFIAVHACTDCCYNISFSFMRAFRWVSFLFLGVLLGRTYVQQC